MPKNLCQGALARYLAFFGITFGIVGLGAAGFGAVADWINPKIVYHVCAFLPALGIVALWPPKLH